MTDNALFGKLTRTKAVSLPKSGVVRQTAANQQSHFTENETPWVHSNFQMAEFAKEEQSLADSAQICFEFAESARISANSERNITGYTEGAPTSAHSR